MMPFLWAAALMLLLGIPSVGAQGTTETPKSTEKTEKKTESAVARSQEPSDPVKVLDKRVSDLKAEIAELRQDPASRMARAVEDIEKNTKSTWTTVFIAAVVVGVALMVSLWIVIPRNFSTVGVKLDTVGTKLDALVTPLNTIATNLASVATQIAALSNKTDPLRDRVNALGECLSAVTKALGAMGFRPDATTSLDGLVTRLEAAAAKLDEAASKLPRTPPDAGGKPG